MLWSFHRGSNNSNHKRLLVVTTVLTILAAKLEIDSQRYQDDASIQVQEALTITAMNIMESIETDFLNAQEMRDHEKADGYTTEAHRYEYQAKVEQIYAERNQKRAAYYQDMAQHEQEQTNDMVQKALQDKIIREELLVNITKEQEQEQEIEKQMEPWNEGPCKNSVITPVCNLLGGCIELQRQLDDEYDIIQHDLQELKSTEKRAFLEDLVARVYQNQANKYNETAEYLFQVASYWQQQSKVDHQNALIANATAYEWHKEEKRLDVRLHKEIGWIQQNNDKIQQLVDEAAHERRMAYRYSGVAVSLAILTILAILPQLFITGTVAVSQIRNEDEFCRRMSLGVQHILLFLFTVGWIGQDLVYLDEYPVTKRAVIVGYFALLVAGLETLFMHALPHAFWSWKHGRPMGLREIISQYTLRMIFSILAYGMEFLMAWVLWKYILFTDYAVRFFAHWSIRCVSLILVITHWAVFEPREDLADDETVGTEEDGEETSSNSVLPSDTSIFFHSVATYDGQRTIQSGSSGNATEDMPLVFFGNMRNALAESRAEHNLSTNQSPYRVNLESETRSLALVFHLLLVVVASCVLRNGLALVWSDHPWITGLAMIGTLAVWFVLLFLFVKGAEDQTYCPVLHDWITWRSNRSKSTYTSIDV